MQNYIANGAVSSRADNDPDRQRQRNAFARDITLEEFGAKNGRAIDQGDFLDRRPGPRPIGELVNRVLDDTTRRAVRHWLKQADQAEGEDRAVCLEAADALMQLAGLRWADLAPRRAA